MSSSQENKKSAGCPPGYSLINGQCIADLTPPPPDSSFVEDSEEEKEEDED